MRFPRPRLSVRMMIGLVAVSALMVWGWMTYFDPVRLWKEAIRDKYDQARHYGAIDDAVNGRVRGLTHDRALDELIGLLGDQTIVPSVRWRVAEALPKFRPREEAGRKVHALVAALRDGSPDVRMLAAIAIRRILGDHPDDGPVEREAVAGLVAALKDTDRRVRRMSACCLGWIGRGEVAIPTLAGALVEPGLDYMSRNQVLTALTRSGPKAADALPAVLELAEVDSVDEGNQGGENGRRGNADVLIRAAGFLHAFGRSDRAVAILRKLAGDRDAFITREASKALARIESATRPAGSEGSP